MPPIRPPFSCRYEKNENNGVAGVLLTVVLTAILIAVSMFLFYNYVLYLHMNGRMLDVHNRLHGDDTHFFLPHDFEISVRTLRWILTKARRAGTSVHGAKNKVAIARLALAYFEIFVWFVCWFVCLLLFACVFFGIISSLRSAGRKDINT